MIHASASNTNKKGFTLIEILIFVTLISLIFITFSAVTAVSVRREALNQHKLVATHYAEELREWIRGQKEINWDSFATGKMGTWCFETEPVAAWPSAGSCADYSLDSLYKREVILSANAEVTQVTAEITVSWREGANVFSVPLKTIYSIYE